MTIDPKQCVILIKTIVTPTGNVYDARKRPYPPGEIPEKYLNETYCTQQGVQFISTETPTVTDRILTETTIKELKGEIGKLVTHDSQTSEVPGLKINEASLEEIEALDGVGKKTAAKVVEERDKKPFESFEELEERVKLGFDRHWNQYPQIQF